MAKEELGLAAHVADTVETVGALHARAQQEGSPHVRRITRISAVLGRPGFLLLLIALVFCWIAINLAAPAIGFRAPDPPPFPWLQGAISLSALLMTTIVVITQNRQMKHTEQRSRLDLQINLLAEQEITKLIELIEELRKDMPNVRDRVDVLAEEMKQPVDTDAVLSALDDTIDAPTTTPQRGENAKTV